jgi:hypothetical protein
MEITCFRDSELSREARTLPAPVYNLTRTLMGRSPSGIVFVPIRSMQILAILDDEEFVFIDHQYKSWIEIAWQHFHPQARSALDEPVPYEAVFYDADGASVMRRLMSEFPKALQALAAKERPDGPARVLKFERRREVPKG